MKCKYYKCWLGGEVEKEDSIKIGNSYYHKECRNQLENKKKIKELFLEKVSNTEPYNVLNKNIDNIIHHKKIDSQYLLFALEYAIKNNTKMKNSYGLHYIINDYKAKQIYQNKIKQEKLKEIKKDIMIPEEKEIQFKFESKKNNWGNLLR